MVNKKDKIKQIIKTWIIDGRAVVLFLFLVFILWGCKVYNDYDVAIDDEVQRYHSLVTYKELFLQEEYTTDVIHTESIPSLQQYGVFYGVALQLPLVLMEHLEDFQLSYAQIFDLRHAYTFLLFVIGACFFYKMCMLVTEGNRRLSILGLLIYFVNPKTLAEAGYNIKDMLCMPMYTVSMYYGIRILKQKRERDILVFALASALCTSVRVVGGTLVLALCMILLYRAWGEGAVRKELRRIFGICYSFGLAYFFFMPKLWSMVFGNDLKMALLLIVAGVLSGLLIRYLFYLGDKKGARIFWVGIGSMGVALVSGAIMTASYWLPLASGLWQAVGKVFSVFGNYTTWQGEVFYLGQWIPGDKLPWHYLFVWMGVSIPLGYILLFVVGGMCQGNAMWKSIRRKEVIHSEMHYCFWLWWIPVVYLLVVNPVLYNGWRHFYFIYNVIALTAVMGLQWLMQKHKHWIYQWGLTGIVTMVVAVTGVWITRNHPYEYAYFSPVFRQWAVDQFDRDYWCMAEQKGLRYILESYTDNKSINFAARAGITLAVDPEKRLNRVKNWWDAEYVMAGHEGFDGDYYFNEIYSVRNGDDLLLDQVWQRAYYRIAKSAVVIESSDRIHQSEGPFSWRVSVADDRVILLGAAQNVISADRIAVFLPEEWVDQSEIMVSSDGAVWYTLRAFAQVRTYEGRISANCNIHDVKFVRIQCPISLAGDEPVEIAVELAGSSETIHKAALSVPVVSVTTNGKEDGLEKLWDGDDHTCWESEKQFAGLSVTVELEKEIELSGVVVDSGDKPWDYPRNMQIQVSSDGQEWTVLESETNDQRLYILEHSVKTRYVRLVIGEVDDSTGNWSIYELDFLKTR